MPIRLVIKYISLLKNDEVRAIDKELSHCKTKLPLLLYALGAGLLSSIVTSFIKGVSELLNNRDIIEHIQKPMIYVLLILVIISLIL